MFQMIIISLVVWFLCSIFSIFHPHRHSWYTWSVDCWSVNMVAWSSIYLFLTQVINAYGEIKDRNLVHVILFYCVVGPSLSQLSYLQWNSFMVDV